MSAAKKIPVGDTPPELIKPKTKLHELVCEADRLIREIAPKDPRYSLMLSCPIEEVRRLTAPERVSYECKAIRWYGRSFLFTDAQAAVVRILWAAYTQGNPKVRAATIIDLLELEPDENVAKPRVDHIFRTKKDGKDIPHPALGYMVHNDNGWWWVGK